MKLWPEKWKVFFQVGLYLRQTVSNKSMFRHIFSKLRRSKYKTNSSIALKSKDRESKVFFMIFTPWYFLFCLIHPSILLVWAKLSNAILIAYQWSLLSTEISLFVNIPTFYREIHAGIFTFALRKEERLHRYIITWFP